VTLRDATPADVPVLLGLIRDLAAFEREPDAVKMTEPQLHDALFGAAPRAAALLAETATGPKGFAIWFETFNTWTGRPGLYVEDVYVAPQARGQGIGRAMFVHIARLAVARGCSRLEWSVLKWNESAIGFYQSLGARAESEWQKYRLSGDTLAALAA
jgi:GNAT superfamily N-acetyltransferase